MDFIDVEAVRTLITVKVNEMLATAGIEERRAAGNTAVVHRLRFAARVLTDLMREIDETPELTEETPEENGVDPRYEAFFADTTPPTTEGD